MSNTRQRRRRCCANGFCGIGRPPPQMQHQIDTLIHVKHIAQQKETPHGCVYFYPGVRTSEGKYSCPVLSVHMYRYSQATADTAQNQQTVTIDHRSNLETQQGPQKVNKEEAVSAEEEVLIIPVEDVTRISFKTEIKKGLQADVERETIRKHSLTKNCCDQCCERLCCCCGVGVACACLPCCAVLCCCNQLKKCCGCNNGPGQVAPLLHTTTIVHSVAAQKKNRRQHVKDEPQPLPKEGCCSIFDPIRCWCCRRKKLVSLIKRTTTVAEEEAQRVVTMTLEYGQYTILDTSSNERVPNGEPQAIHSRQQFANTRLEFYLLTNTEYDPRNFDQHKHQAEILCRTVMHLKGMRNHYPSDTDLDKILGQPHKNVFGTVFTEPVLQLEHDLNAAIENGQIQNLPEQQALERQPTETPE